MGQVHLPVLQVTFTQRPIQENKVHQTNILPSHIADFNQPYPIIPETYLIIKVHKTTPSVV